MATKFVTGNFYLLQVSALQPDPRNCAIASTKTVPHLVTLSCQEWADTDMGNVIGFR